MLRLAAAGMLGWVSLAAPAVCSDEAALQVLAGPCANCHGPDGRSPGAIPPLAGVSEAQLRDRMSGFRDGSQQGTIMPRIMKAYDDTQIAGLARWFAKAGQ